MTLLNPITHLYPRALRQKRDVHCSHPPFLGTSPFPSLKNLNNPKLPPLEEPSRGCLTYPPSHGCTSTAGGPKSCPIQDFSAHNSLHNQEGSASAARRPQCLGLPGKSFLAAGICKANRGIGCSLALAQPGLREPHPDTSGAKGCLLSPSLPSFFSW